jgi:hypothetical protein
VAADEAAAGPGWYSLRDRYEAIEVGGLIQTIDHAVATTVSLSIAGKIKRVYDFYTIPKS